MKMIIRESKLDMVMTEYLHGWMNSRTPPAMFDSFIVLNNPNEQDDIEDDIDMEYDSEDGRLWFKKQFRQFLMDLFGKERHETNLFVKKVFEDKFNVKVKYVDVN